jgi:hypothetical protein
MTDDRERWAPILGGCPGWASDAMALRMPVAHLVIIPTRRRRLMRRSAAIEAGCVRRFVYHERG